MGMTLDEEIKHIEEVAEEQEELYRICPASESEIFHCDGTKDCKTLKNGKNKGCQKCAEEHRQLAEWLKDYKRLKEQEPKADVLDKIRQEIEQIANEEQKHDKKWALGLRYAVKIINKYKTESDNIMTTLEQLKIEKES